MKSVVKMEVVGSVGVSYYYNLGQGFVRTFVCIFCQQQLRQTLWAHQTKSPDCVALFVFLMLLLGLMKLRSVWSKTIYLSDRLLNINKVPGEISHWAQV